MPDVPDAGMEDPRLLGFLSLLRALCDAATVESRVQRLLLYADVRELYYFARANPTKLHVEKP